MNKKLLKITYSDNQRTVAYEVEGDVEELVQLAKLFRKLFDIPQVPIARMWFGEDTSYLGKCTIVEFWLAPAKSKWFVFEVEKIEEDGFILILPHQFYHLPEYFTASLLL